MRRSIALLCLASALPWWGCSEDTFTDSGSGAAAATAGSAGASANGGASGNGGALGGGNGSAGSGGSIDGSIGSGGSGGSVGGSGGSTGNGGSAAGNGGSAGSAGSSSGSGGSASTGGGAGTGGSTGGTGGSTGGTGGSTGGTGGSTGGTGGKSCEDLLSDVRAKLAQAKACCLVCTIANQCSGSVAGVCCPETVNFADSGATVSYLKALEVYQNAGCSYACPRIACRLTPSNMCQTDGSCL